MSSVEKNIHIVGIGGTLRDGSTGLRALEETLVAAKEAGATTELLDLRELALPMYEPGRPIEEDGENVEGNVRDEGVAKRLESLGRLVVEMATKLGPGAEERSRELLNIA